MKNRMLYCFISMLLFFSSVASAEEFSLRNGIVFGDTLEIVKQKETLTIQSGSEEKTDKVWFDGAIAGMDGSVRFDFDEETGKLTDMLYDFDSKEDKNFVDNDYSTLEKSLKRKYGDPLGNTGGSLYIITGTAIENAATIIGLWKYMLDGDGDFRDYDEWIVEADGYKVKIDLISYYYRTKEYDYSYKNAVSYHYFTDEDYQNAIQEKKDENAIVDNDL